MEVNLTSIHWCFCVNFEHWSCKFNIIIMEFRGDLNVPLVSLVNRSWKTSDYIACLLRLKSAMPNYERVLHNELRDIPAASPTIFSLVSRSGDTSMFQRDRYSTSLIHGYMRLRAAPFTAAIVSGDGSCLFNAASLLIIGKCKLMYCLDQPIV